MTIREIVGQGFYYARTCRSLWLFGFFAGIASGGSNGGGGGGGDGSAGAGGIAVSGLLSFFATEAAVAAVALVLVIVAAGFLMRFLSEGALIEGMVRARQGGVMTTREGFRAGWAHWGVLLRIALLYFARHRRQRGTAGGAVRDRAAGVRPARGGALGVPALLIAVPWLVTLSLVQAFAIADRRAREPACARRDRQGAALSPRPAHPRAQAHGRGLRRIARPHVLAFMVPAPVVLLLAALALVLPVWPLIVVGGLVLLPAGCVLTAMLGTFGRPSGPSAT